MMAGLSTAAPAIVAPATVIALAPFTVMAIAIATLVSVAGMLVPIARLCVGCASHSAGRQRQAYGDKDTLENFHFYSPARRSGCKGDSLIHV
jgi:hypothetical protein